MTAHYVASCYICFILAVPTHVYMLYIQMHDRYKLALYFVLSRCGKLGVVYVIVQGLGVDKQMFYRLLRVSYILQGHLDHWLLKVFVKLNVFIEEQ